MRDFRIAERTLMFLELWPDPAAIRTQATFISRFALSQTIRRTLLPHGTALQSSRKIRPRSEQRRVVCAFARSIVQRDRARGIITPARSSRASAAIRRSSGLARRRCDVLFPCCATALYANRNPPLMLDKKPRVPQTMRFNGLPYLNFPS